MCRFSFIRANPTQNKSIHLQTILGHHVATILVLFDPLMIPNHAFYTSCGLLVCKIIMPCVERSTSVRPIYIYIYPPFFTYHMWNLFLHFRIS